MKKLFFAAAALIAPVSAGHAAAMVTYNFTTTALGYGIHVDQPSLASFEVPLASVLAGKIQYSDITNIQLAYPGLNLTSFTPTSIGLDFAAFVDPLTGAPIYHDVNQGLGVVGYEGFLFSDSFLSITFDAVAYNGFGQPLTSVADQFNALKNGAPYAGYPTAGYWSATFPAAGGVPEPETWATMLLGFGLLAVTIRTSRRRQRPVISDA